jgi:lipid-A-disaccharide synthase
MPSKNPRVMIVAAEASSSLYAQRLLEQWQKESKSIEAFGVGSQAMERLGFEILGRSEEMAVVGLQEVIAHWDLIKSTFHKLVDAVESRKPDVVLLLDYPDFNLRLAKKIKALGVPIVYYISPQVWAWRTSRVHLIKRLVDKMLVLFPFEKEFYQKFDVPVDFVGHPLLDEIARRFHDNDSIRLQRNRYGIQDGQVALALMPGSRTSELKHHLQTQLDVAQKLHNKYPNLRCLLLVAPTISQEQIQSLLPHYDFPLSIIKDEPLNMIALSDIVLCASGTATLMVGLMEKPMIVMYRMNAISAFFAKIFVQGKIKYFSMVNLILDENVVPEFFQDQANPTQLANTIAPLIERKELRSQMAAKLAELKNRLGARGATERVAHSLEKFFKP